MEEKEQMEQKPVAKFTVDDVNGIVERVRRVERLRERGYTALHIAKQRATAAGDQPELIATLTWIESGMEVLLNNAMQMPPPTPQQPPQQEPVKESSADDDGQ